MLGAGLDAAAAIFHDLDDDAKAHRIAGCGTCLCASDIESSGQCSHIFFHPPCALSGPIWPREEGRRCPADRCWNGARNGAVVFLFLARATAGQILSSTANFAPTVLCIRGEFHSP